MSPVIFEPGVKNGIIILITKIIRKITYERPLTDINPIYRNSKSSSYIKQGV